MNGNFNQPYVDQLNTLREKWPKRSQRVFWRASMEFLANLEAMTISYGRTEIIPGPLQPLPKKSYGSPEDRPKSFCGIPIRIDHLMEGSQCVLALDEENETYQYLKWVHDGCQRLGVPLA